LKVTRLNSLYNIPDKIDSDFVAEGGESCDDYELLSQRDKLEIEWIEF